MAAPVSFGGRVPVPPCAVSSSGSLSGGLASSSTVPAGRSAGPPPASSDPLSRSCGFVISCSFLSRAAMLRRCWRIPREGARQPASIASNYRSIRPATTEQRRAACDVPQITRLISGPVPRIGTDHASPESSPTMASRAPGDTSVPSWPRRPRLVVRLYNRIRLPPRCDECVARRPSGAELCAQLRG
ncbi:MAG: hypothetical protein JWR48_6444 [Mycobacterium sp.]|nr:hypothetical protein [Mycobacterium sp.]